MRHTINHTTIENDFPPEVIEERKLPKDIVQRLEGELHQFSGACRYDHNIKKIVYRNLPLAEKIYDLIQQREMKDHIREKYGDNPTRDQENEAGFEWILQHREGFRNLWVKTHKLLSPER